MRILVALFAIGHGIAHLPGFLVAWQLRTMPEFPYRMTIFDGSLDIGVFGTRVLGIAWLVVSLAFGIAGAGLLIRAPWASDAVLAAVALSIPLCVAGWPDTRFGLAANVILAVFLAVSASFGWLE